MRLSELLGSEVVDRDGRSAGRVHDLRLQQDGPVIDGFGASLRLHGLIVGRGALGARLGFDRGDVKGPLLVKLVVGWLGHRRYVAWEQVRELEPGRVRISAAADELAPPDPAGGG
jgi:hypothetical protein